MGLEFPVESRSSMSSDFKQHLLPDTKTRNELKAARVVARRKIEFLDVPETGPLEEGEVQIKLEALSICGSDIYLEYDAELPEEDRAEPSE